jgi:hypothetical protein
LFDRKARLNFFLTSFLSSAGFEFYHGTSLFVLGLRSGHADSKEEVRASLSVDSVKSMSSVEPITSEESTLLFESSSW